MLSLLAAASLAATPAPAHTPEDEAAKAAADAAYGKEIPWAAICLRDVTAGASAPARLVGVKRRETGCEPFGVMVGGVWTKVEAAVPALVGADAWKALPAAKKDEVLKEWVDAAWLAFAAPTGAPAVGHAGGRTQITRTYLRRDGEAGLGADVRSVFSFDAAGALVDRTDTVAKKWRTTLFVQQLARSGLTEEVAQKGVESSGMGIRTCWQDAWELDRTLDGFTHLQWTVAGGKATKITEVDASTMPAGVVTCIGNALQRTTWPPEAAGSATFVFGLDRREDPAR